MANSTEMQVMIAYLEGFRAEIDSKLRAIAKGMDLVNIPSVMTSEEAAKYLGVTGATVRNMIERGEIRNVGTTKAKKVGRADLVRVKAKKDPDLMRLLDLAR